MSPRKKSSKLSVVQSDVVTPTPILTPTDTTISRPIGETTPNDTTNSTDFSGPDNDNDNNNLAAMAQDIDMVAEKKTIDRLKEKSSVEKTASMASDTTATDSGAISSSVSSIEQQQIDTYHLVIDAYREHEKHESINKGLDVFAANNEKKEHPLVTAGKHYDSFHKTVTQSLLDRQRKKDSDRRRRFS